MEKITDIDRLVRINELLTQGKIEKAKEYCKKYINSNRVASAYVKLLMEEKEYDEAKSVCLKNMDNPSIRTQYVYMLIAEENFDEARRLCEKYEDDGSLEPQHILILEREGQYEKIEEIVKRFPYNRFVIKSYVITLSNRGEFDKAIKYCDVIPHDPVLADIKKDLEQKRVKSVAESKVKLYFSILDYINEGKIKEAKQLCSNNLGDKKIFELYLSILEKERVLLYKKKLQ
ncbi:MAG: hypothetical protein IKF36_04025 [Bacilli bacterium]|nr:hypothetical protein [Bacilli bacterium]